MPRQQTKPPTKEKAQQLFGFALRGFREEQGVTQERLAELADLHTTYVGSVERGERNVSLNNITQLAYALKIPVSTLVACLDPGKL